MKAAFCSSGQHSSNGHAKSRQNAALKENLSAFLRIDFPRIPVAGCRALFDALSILGAELVQWHLLENPTVVAITATTTAKGVSVPVFLGSDRKLLKVAEKSRELADLQATAAGPSG